jgi:outer membrane protein assembly factor BamB
MSFRRIACIAFLLASFVGAPSFGVFGGVFGGVVQSVRGNRLVIEYGPDERIKSFPIPATATITRDDAAFDLVDLAPGAKVFVYTTGTGEVYKVKVAAEPAGTARVAGDGPEIQPGRAAAEKQTWTTFRGPERTNRSAATGLLTEWPAAGPKAIAVYRGLGEGYSSVAVADGRIFTLGSRGSDEMLFALDWNDPRQPLWTFRNGVQYRDGTGDGPRGTPTIDGDLVFALGANGDLACVDAKTGQTHWRKNILTEFAGSNITWGISESPLVDGERLIVTPGGRTATMAALEKKTGRTIWKAVVPGTPRAAYASAIVQTVGNVRQYVNFTSKGMMGVKADDGTPLWGDDAASNGTANCSTPLAVGNHVFYASGYGAGGALLRLTPGRNTIRSQLAYKSREMVNHHGGMVLVDGHVYGTNDNALVCLDVRDGKVKWRDRSVGKGSLTYAEGHLYVVGEKGEIALVEATPEEYREKGRFEHVNRSKRPLWAHPVVHDGRLLIRDQDTLTMYEIAAEK